MAKAIHLISLRYTIYRRHISQIPLLYILFIGSLLLSLAYLLLKIDLPATRQSIIFTIFIQLFLCSRINYKEDKRLFFKQYRYLFSVSIFMDAVLLSIPFALINGYLWMTAILTSSIYAVFNLSGKDHIKYRPVVASPFFIRSSYLWHAQQRYSLPVIWLLICIFLLIAFLHDNYNLGIVFLGGGALLVGLIVMLESENIDFIRIYLNSKRFITRTLFETSYNTLLYLLPLIITCLFLFPDKWYITILIIPVILLVNLQLLWIKYTVYPSSLLTLVVFLIGLLMQFILGTTLYGLLFIPIYTVVLYFLYKNNLNRIVPRG